MPYLLFAFRKIPQASMGFSTFQLLHRWDVQGPLDVLKESWEAGGKEGESVVSCIFLMRERLGELLS